MCACVLPRDGGGKRETVAGWPVEHANEVLRRITGEADSHDALARVADELRRRYDGHERRSRQAAAQVDAYSPRRGSRRGTDARPAGSRR